MLKSKKAGAGLAAPALHNNMNKKKKSKYVFLAVAGVLGSGKTTACKLLSRRLDLFPFEENVAGNAFIPLFYKDSKRWAFPVQLHYLHEKGVQLEKIKQKLMETGVVQDSPVYQDYYTYARAQAVLGNMNEEEFKLYEKYANKLLKSYPTPDLIIHLDVSLPVLKARIAKRGREYEKNIDVSYFKLLSKLQRSWMKKIAHVPIININADMLDLEHNKNDQNKFVEIITKHLATKR